jgi:serine/threonine protein phosphatase PrpC
LLGRSLADSIDVLSEKHLLDVFRCTSAALGAYVQQHGPFDLYGRDYPGTIGTLIVASQDMLTWAHLGDTLLLLLRGNAGTVLSRDQVAGFRAWRTANMTTLPASLPDRVRYLHGSVRNNASLTHSYGVLTGEPAALQFVETGTTPLERGDRIVLATDGLTPLWSTMEWAPNPQEPVPPAIVEHLRRATADQLLHEAEEAEERRQIRSDDKTIILADLG